MINSHVHLIAEKTEAYATAFMECMNEHSIRASILFGSQCEQSTGDDEVLAILERYPDKFIPFLTRSLDFDNPNAARTCIQRLEEGPWRGVGEIFLDCTDDLYVRWIDQNGNEQCAIKPVPEKKEKDPLFAEVFSYCGEHRLPVLTHCMDANVISRTCALYPKTTFIWAHTDHDFWPTVPAELLRKHSNLVCEFGVSFRFRSEALVEGRMAQWEYDKIREWGKNCHQFPDRIVWGTDLFKWNDVDPNVFSRGMRAWELVASEIDQDVLDKVTDSNIAKLTGLNE